MCEYLLLLQHRQKWNEREKNLAVGDIAIDLLHENHGLWEECWSVVYPDAHGLVRSVKLKTKSSTIDRPIFRLCLVYGI